MGCSCLAVVSLSQTMIHSISHFSLYQMFKTKPRVNQVEFCRELNLQFNEMRKLALCVSFFIVGSLHFYRPKTKLCFHSVNRVGDGRGSHVTITHDTLDLTIQVLPSPPGPGLLNMGPHYTGTPNPNHSWT